MRISLGRAPGGWCLGAVSGGRPHFVFRYVFGRPPRPSMLSPDPFIERMKAGCDWLTVSEPGVRPHGATAGMAAMPFPSTSAVVELDFVARNENGL